MPRRLTRAATQAPAGHVVLFGGESMGTSWSVRAVVDPAADPAVPERAVAQALAAVVAEMSHWERDSAVGRFNHAAPGSWHALPDALFAVLDHALALAAATAGAFDPTAGRLVDLWGFGPSPPRRRAPDEGPIAAALAASGWRRLVVDVTGRAVLQPGGLWLDLSAIAKGYGVDAAARALRDSGVDHFLVEVGGELLGAGLKPDGTPWWVEIELPPGFTAAPIVAALHGLAVATSGNYRRFFDVDGRRYSHTLDPRSGRPVDNRLASVTVLDASCMAADALATALTVMGVEAGLDFASRRGAAAHFVIDDAGRLGERMTPAFAAMLD